MARCEHENDQMCCLYFVYFCVFQKKLFFYVMCFFMCFRVFSPIFISMSLLGVCVFLCFCVFVFYCCVHVVGSAVSVFFVFLCFFLLSSVRFFLQNLSVKGVIVSTVRSPIPHLYPAIRPYMSNSSTTVLHSSLTWYLSLFVPNQTMLLLQHAVPCTASIPLHSQ